MNPLSISVIIPTYNRAHLLQRSIKSVISEMAEEDELIVVDDGSTDDTASVIARFGNRVRLICLARSGAGRARNAGVKKAAKELVAFLDSDDEYLPGRLELARRLLAARPDILFTFSDMVGTTKDGVVERFFLRSWHRDPRPWHQILGPATNYSDIAPLPEGLGGFKVYVGSLYARLARRPYVSTITVTVRREKSGRALFFDEDWPLYEDWGCMGRLSRAGQAAYLEIETAWQHSHEGPRLTAAGALTHATARVEVLKRIWGQDPEYLSASGTEYARLLDHHMCKKVRYLFMLGRRAEAVREMRSITRVPLLYRVLAMVPGPLTKLLVVLGRPLKRLVQS